MKEEKITQKTSRSESGAILPMVIILMLALTLTGIAFLNAGIMENGLVRREIAKTQAFNAAEAGIEVGLFRLRQLLSNKPIPAETDLSAIAIDIEANPPITDFAFNMALEKDGDREIKEMETGPYAGLIANIQGYKITSEVTDQNSVSARIIQKVEDQQFHLFQFGVFYSLDLELQPGPDMSFAGRIHSNENIYLDSNSTLYIDSRITSAGKIFKGSMPGDPGTEGGTILIKDGQSVYQDMYYDYDLGTWFDHDHPNWVPGAAQRWDENVQDQAYGVTELNPPLPPLTPMIDMIKPGDTISPYASSESELLKDARLYWQAGLRILDGVAYLQSGTIVKTQKTDGGNLLEGLDYWDPDEAQTMSPIMTKSFYDYREGADITIVEIDVEKLMRREELIQLDTIGGNLCLENGILFASESSLNKGIRLVNGSRLPLGGLTVGTDNPLYIQGNYNTDNKQPAAVFCDALNILSNIWNDDPNHNRIATATTVNTSLVTGIVKTESGYYSGGVENLPRFLENWSDKTFTLSGSMVALWESEQARGKWIYGMPYYRAPNRNWGFDQDLLDIANLPPATPTVGTVKRTHWQEE